MQTRLPSLPFSQDISVYWDTLHAAGIDKQRLASFDRAITQEPDLKASQKEGLLKDLGAYLLTLKAVHTGADLQVCHACASQGQ